MCTFNVRRAVENEFCIDLADERDVIKFTDLCETVGLSRIEIKGDYEVKCSDETEIFAQKLWNLMEMLSQHFEHRKHRK